MRNAREAAKGGLLPRQHKSEDHPHGGQATCATFFAQNHYRLAPQRWIHSSNAPRTPLYPQL